MLVALVKGSDLLARRLFPHERARKIKKIMRQIMPAKRPKAPPPPGWWAGEITGVEGTGGTMGLGRGFDGVDGDVLTAALGVAELIPETCQTPDEFDASSDCCAFIAASRASLWRSARCLWTSSLTALSLRI
jgi:hypothetical protein